MLLGPNMNTAYFNGVVLGEFVKTLFPWGPVSAVTVLQIFVKKVVCTCM